MTVTSEQFFEGLTRRGHEPMLTRLSATLRWDVLGDGRTEYWLVGIEHGAVAVTRSDEPVGLPDCVIRAERDVCDDVVSGRTSALAALLRGAASVEGDPELMVLAQRLFTRQRAGSAGRCHPSAGPGPDG